MDRLCRPIRGQEGISVLRDVKAAAAAEGQHSVNEAGVSIVGADDRSVAATKLFVENLVVIAYKKQAFRISSDDADEPFLGEVEVLELVDNEEGALDQLGIFTG